MECPTILVSQSSRAFRDALGSDTITLKERRFFVKVAFNAHQMSKLTSNPANKIVAMEIYLLLA
jgi:hypothetical protein